MPANQSDLERRAAALLDRQLGDVVNIPRSEVQSARTKGRVGHHIERHFGVATNNDAGPDFPTLGVELKTVPVRRLKSRGLSSKERTFITMINYGDIVEQPFSGSPLDTKTQRTLYVFYEWVRDQPTADACVLAWRLHERDEAALDMARRAHEHVKRVVASGTAHLLSEGDTLGIGAATKDAGGKWVAQPFSSEKARRRGFAWKAAYTTALFNDQIADVPGGLSALLGAVESAVRSNRGTTVRELRDRYHPGASDGWKSVTGAVARRLLGSTSSTREPDDFKRYGLLVRAIRVGPDGLPWESTSFPAVDFRDVAEEPWESSPLVEQLRSILLVVFRDPHKSVLSSELERIVHWQPSAADVQIMAKEYELFRSAIARSRPEAAPTESRTSILHMRPHGTNGSDVVPLPDGRLFRRSSFWLNRSYLQRVLAR